MKPAGIIDLSAYPELTLNYFCTDSDRLHDFAKKNRIAKGEFVVIRGRSGRIRVFKVEADGIIKVELCEFSRRLSVQLAVLEHFEVRLKGADREAVEELRAAVEAKLKRQSD